MYEMTADIRARSQGSIGGDETNIQSFQTLEATYTYLRQFNLST